MNDKAESRFQPERNAYRKRKRLDCFTSFFGESVWDALGVVMKAESANKCQDCPDADICYRLCLLRQLESVVENQRKIMARLNVLENR
ncbi:MAG: hypothetical protein JXQ83_01205 [Candidatus Glassbacteria bacterium]|nr:hypothetical protein [Candidatus Glassbacteria bacterium]